MNNYLATQSLLIVIGEMTPIKFIKYIPVGPFISLDHILYSPTLSSFQLYLLPLGEEIYNDIILYKPLGPHMLSPLTSYEPCLVPKRIPSLMPSRVVQIAISPPSSKIKNGGYIFLAGVKSVIGVVVATTGIALKMLKRQKAEVINLKDFKNTVYTNYTIKTTLANSFNLIWRCSARCLALLGGLPRSYT